MGEKKLIKVAVHLHDIKDYGKEDSNSRRKKREGQKSL